MRHRMKGRKLGRNPSHRRAMMKNLASSLFLSERDDDRNEAGYKYEEFETAATGLNRPKVKGRIITTLEKAKHIRPLVEKCITIARHAHTHLEAARQYATSAAKDSAEWKRWREGEQWQKWNNAMAPALAARRRAIVLLGNVFAVDILFDVVAPRFLDRNGGYTRILRLAAPRLGDAGTRAILEFVGENDRRSKKSERPQFDAGLDSAAVEETPEETVEETTSEETSEEQPAEGDSDKSEASKEE